MTAETFINELNRLIVTFPKLPTHSLNSDNSEYGDQLYYCKNMLNCFDTVNSTDCMYTFDSHSCVNCIDCDYSIEAQLVYESVDAHKCFNSSFLQDCYNVRDSQYAYNCYDCNNVFACTYLRGKSFCILNRQLTETEYHEKVKQFKTLPPEHIFELLEELKKRYPLTQTHGLNNENSPYGDYIYNCKNCYMCYDTRKSENSAYVYDSQEQINCYNVTFSDKSQMSYEIIDSTHIFNSNFVIWCGHCTDSSYIVTCGNVKNCLGCVNLYQKQYCILNRQFSKEEYESISKPLLEELKTKNLGWGNIVF